MGSEIEARSLRSEERTLVPPEPQPQSQFHIVRAAANTCQRQGDRKSIQGQLRLVPACCRSVRGLCGRGHTSLSHIGPWWCARCCCRHANLQSVNTNLHACSLFSETFSPNGTSRAFERIELTRPLLHLRAAVHQKLARLWMDLGIGAFVLLTHIRCHLSICRNAASDG